MECWEEFRAVRPPPLRPDQLAALPRIGVVPEPHVKLPQALRLTLQLSAVSNLLVAGLPPRADAAWLQRALRAEVSSFPECPVEVRQGSELGLGTDLEEDVREARYGPCCMATLAPRALTPAP